MNGFADHGLDEAAFGEKRGFTSNLQTFDAFRKLPYHNLLLKSPFQAFYQPIEDTYTQQFVSLNPQCAKLTFCSQNKARLHSPLVNWRIRYYCALCNLHPVFLQRASSMASRLGNPPLFRRKGGLA